jgi:hypothetical protein
MKFCQNCGAKLEPESKFCVTCGTPVVSATQPSVEPQKQAPPEPIYHQTREAANSFNEAISGKTNLIQRVVNIITKPKQEWLVVAEEKPNAIKMIGGYVFILALIPALSGLIKYGVLGFSFMGESGQSILAGVQIAIIQLLSALIGVYLLALVIDLLAPSFDSTKNFGRSLQLAVYSSTIQWIAGILLLFSFTASKLIMLISLYAIYLLAVGMPILKNTPQEKVVGYVALTIVAMIAISLVLALVLGSIMGLFFVQGIGF